MNKKTVIYLITILFLVIATSFILYIKTNRYLEIKDTLEIKEKLFIIKENNLNNFKNNLVTLEKLETNMRKEKNKVVFNNLYYDNIINIFNLSKKNNLVVLDTNIQKVIAGNFVEIIFTGEYIGTYLDCDNFITEINNIEIFNKIKKIRLSTEDTINESNIELGIEIMFIYENETNKTKSPIGNTNLQVDYDPFYYKEKED